MSLLIAITGATGQVGWQLQRSVSPLAEVMALTPGDLDLRDPDAAARTVREISPQILINAAAFTNVDGAEQEPGVAQTVNAEAPGRMANEMARLGGLMIHYSTDYVFDGAKPGAYTENDEPNPLNVYGRTKLAGDRAVQASGCACIILRSSWVYDVRGTNFLRRILKLAREREELRIVDDQHGAPTWARSIADATAAIVAKAANGGMEADWRHTGLYNLTAAGETTWAGFARTILSEYEALCSWPADSSEFSTPLLAKRVVPIRSDQYQTAAVRPRNSLLSNSRLQAEFGIQLPEWQKLLRLAMLDSTR